MESAVPQCGRVSGRVPAARAGRELSQGKRKPLHLQAAPSAAGSLALSPNGTQRPSTAPGAGEGAINCHGPLKLAKQLIQDPEEASTRATPVTTITTTTDGHKHGTGIVETGGYWQIKSRPAGRDQCKQAIDLSVIQNSSCPLSSYCHAVAVAVAAAMPCHALCHAQCFLLACPLFPVLRCAWGSGIHPPSTWPRRPINRNVQPTTSASTRKLTEQRHARQPRKRESLIS